MRLPFGSGMTTRTDWEPAHGPAPAGCARQGGVVSRLIRVAVVVYILGLSLALVVGNWPLEGPSLLGAGTRGIHLGDLGVVVATTVACLVVLRSD